MTLPLPQDLFGPNFTNFLLPWIFTFAIVYGLLFKAGIFGTVNKQVSVALAFVIAFFVTVTGGAQLGAFFINLFGGAATFVAGILVIILFLSLVGYTTQEGYKNEFIIGGLVILGVILFLVSQGPISGFRLDQNTASLIFWAVLILAVIFYVSKGGETTPAAGAAQPRQPGQ